MTSLDLEKAGFHCRGAPEPPEQTRQSQHQFPLYGRLGIIVSCDGRFESFVIFGILQRTDHCFGRKAMAYGIAPGSLFTCCGGGTGAFARVASVGLDLPERSHCAPAALIGFVL